MTAPTAHEGTAPGGGSGGGGLASNLVHFANFLRRAGMPVGTGQVEDAARAVERVGLKHRRDVYWALHCVFVSRHEQDEVFGYAFAAFWRAPMGVNDELAALPLPQRGERVPHHKPPRRILEAWQERQRARVSLDEGDDPDAPGTASDRELLKRRDFEQMSVQEIDDVKALLRRMRFPWRDRPTRRWRRHPRGPRIDVRATVQRSLRTAGEPVVWVRRTRARRPPPLVIVCDISGSMERYSRMFLHFVHALTNDRDRVEVFVFGTRLTHITRALRHRDVDVAFAALSEEVRDWGGGTRIGACLEAFNRDWSRRVLGGGAEMLLVTDGLERADEALLDAQAHRLARWVRRVIWLNPLLRYEAFEPQAEGVRTLLKYVTEHRPVHNLESLQALAEALALEPRQSRDFDGRDRVHSR